MKIKLVYSIIIAVLFSCESNTNKPERITDLENKNLVSTVKRVETEIFRYYAAEDTLVKENNANSLTFNKNEVLVFNADGNLSTSQEFFQNNRLVLEKKFEYDEKNRLVKILNINHYSGSNVTSLKEYFYNENDSIYKMILTDENNREHETIIKSDSLENTDVMLSKYNGTLISRYFFKKDLQGNIIEEKHYDDHTILNKIIERTYENNLLTKENYINYNKWDTITSKILFKYDNKKRLIERKLDFFSEDENYTTILFTYDDDSNLIERKTLSKYFQGEGFYERIKKWDDKGNLVQELRQKSKNEHDNYAKIYIYEFDTKGNWIQRESYTDGKLLFVTKRTISYFSE